MGAGRTHRIEREKSSMPKKKQSADLIPPEGIEKRIYLIRSHKVMLDSDLAELYAVETRVLVQGVKRNLDRFPEDFMFQLTREELELWRSRIVISDPAARMALRRRLVSAGCGRHLSRQTRVEGN
jgi:hypothetical protein